MIEHFFVWLLGPHLAVITAIGVFIVAGCVIQALVEDKVRR